MVAALRAPRPSRSLDGECVEVDGEAAEELESLFLKSFQALDPLGRVSSWSRDTCALRLSKVSVVKWERVVKWDNVAL